MIYEKSVWPTFEGNATLTKCKLKRWLFDELRDIFVG